MDNNTTEKATKKRPMMRDYLSTGEAAQMLGVTKKWVQRCCQSGKIAASMPLNEWRIKRSVIEGMLEGEGSRKP